VIVWLVEPLFTTLTPLHSVFELRERHTHERFGDQLAIHLLQLGSPLASNATQYDASIDRWARFLVAKDDAEFSQLASEDPIMATAKQDLDLLSLDPATRRLARERSDAVKLYKLDLVASKAEGKAEGEAKGKIEVLLKLLGLRFGSIPDTIRVRVEGARAEQLDVWIERVLTAETLGQVLAP